MAGHRLGALEGGEGLPQGGGGAPFQCIRGGGGLQGFRGGHGPGYMGLAATAWVPMGAQVPVVSLNDHPNPSQGQRKGFTKNRILKKKFQASLNSLPPVKTAKSSLARGHMGGANWGYLELGPGTPAMG